jgi:hypothetical protein
MKKIAGRLITKAQRWERFLDKSTAHSLVLVLLLLLVIEQ